MTYSVTNLVSDHRYTINGLSEQPRILRFRKDAVRTLFNVLNGDGEMCSTVLEFLVDHTAPILGKIKSARVKIEKMNEAVCDGARAVTDLNGQFCHIEPILESFRYTRIPTPEMQRESDDANRYEFDPDERLG